MKIPKNAIKVFEGILYSAYQWEQEMYDGSQTIFEGLRGPDAACVITIFEDGEFGITKEEQPGRNPFFSLVAGRIEKDESPLDGAKRELYEETGIESPSWELYREYNESSKIDKTLYLYIARDCKITGKPMLDNGEKVELYKVNFDEFIDMVAHPKFRIQEFKIEVLEAYYRGGKRAVRKLFGI